MWGLLWHSTGGTSTETRGLHSRSRGCNFPNCPRTSIYEASERDFRIVLAEDAVSGLYRTGREELENIGVRLMPTADLIEALAPTATTRA